MNKSFESLEGSGTIEGKTISPESSLADGIVAIDQQLAELYGLVEKVGDDEERAIFERVKRDIAELDIRFAKKAELKEAELKEGGK
jgi:hypothetical protein